MKILFFDGYCSLCNALVDWGIRHDQKKNIQFASLQGETAKKYLAHTQYTVDIDTVIYFRDEKIYQQSSAVLYFFKDIGGVYSLFFIFIVLPTLIRDFFYKLVARNRYKFFKKRDTCRLPTESERERLLN